MAAAAAAPGAPPSVPPPRERQAPPLSRERAAVPAGEREAAPLAKAAKPKAAEPARPAPPPAPAGDAAGDDDDSDINDEMIAAALAAKLSTAREEGPPPAGEAPAPKETPAPEPAATISAADKSVEVRDSEAREEAAQRTVHAPPLAARPARDPPGSATPAAGAVGPAARADGPRVPATKAKAWGAPPPLRGARGLRARTRDLDDIGVKPKTPPVVIPEAPVPALFDQWLACLKFVTGWNDQCTHTAKEVKEALREHLRDEGIENPRTIDRLCSTVVPLLLDLRRIDGAVVKNLRAEVLRGLKIVQVSVLRIVTFELCRERDAKAALKRKLDGPGGAGAEERKTGGLLAGAQGATYLASDISSLAKVVQHFRFDRSFSEGLHQLILSIRRQKRVVRTGVPAARRGAGAAEDATAGSRKRRAAEAVLGGRRAGAGARGVEARSAAPSARKRPLMVS